MSTPYLAQDIIAILLETVGTFLLAVEAIKLDNLRKFRDTVFRKPLGWLRPSVWVTHDATSKEIEAAKQKKMLRVLLVLAAIGFIVSLVVFGLFAQVSPGQRVSRSTEGAAGEGSGLTL